MRTVFGAWVVGFLILLSGPLQADDAADARAVLDEAMRAHGGADNLAKTRYLTRSAKGEISRAGKQIPFTGEAALHLPDQARWSFDLETDMGKLPVVLVINGDKGWRAGGAAVDELSKGEFDDLREEAYVNWVATLAPLSEKTFELSTLAEAKVNDQPAIGIKAKRKDRPDVKLYFNKRTGLLVKIEHASKEAGLAITKERLFSEHKLFDGVKLPTKYQELADGKKMVEWTATSYKLPAKLEESSFDKP